MTTNNPTEAALEPCPFCGGQPEIFTGAYKSRKLPYGVRARVVCDKCKIERSQAHSGGDAELATKWAIERWNNRAATAEVLRGVLEGVLSEFAITDSSDPVDLWIHDRLKRAIAKRMEAK